MAGDFHYGGQAIIEGVMIRGKKHVASALRKPNGEIVIHTEPANSLSQRYRWLRFPLVRGTPALIDALRIGFRALIRSADVAIEAEGEKPPSRLYYALTLAFALAVGIVLFVILPSLALQPLSGHHMLMNLAEGVLKIVIFVAYVLIVSRSRDIRRIFQYHGAEHMVINAFEAGRDISPKAAKDYKTLHLRCGSSFIMLVLFIAILVHAVAGWPEWYIRLPLRLAMLIPIAGISYEIMKLAASPKASWLAAVTTKPGLWLQSITTRQPDEDQIEVAIAALNAVLAEERKEDEPAAEASEAVAVKEA